MGRTLRTVRAGEKKLNVEPLSTGTTSENIPNYGVTVIAATAANNYVLGAPEVGVRKTLVFTGPTSAAVVVRGSVGTSVTFDSSADTQLSVASSAVDTVAVDLVGASSTRWHPLVVGTGCTVGTS